MADQTQFPRRIPHRNGVDGCVHGQQGEPGVVVLRDRPSWQVVIDIPHREVLKVTATLVGVARLCSGVGHDEIPFESDRAGCGHPITI